MTSRRPSRGRPRRGDRARRRRRGRRRARAGLRAEVGVRREEPLLEVQLGEARDSVGPAARSRGARGRAASSSAAPSFAESPRSRRFAPPATDGAYAAAGRRRASRSSASAPAKRARRGCRRAPRSRSPRSPRTRDGGEHARPVREPASSSTPSAPPRWRVGSGPSAARRVSRRSRRPNARAATREARPHLAREPQHGEDAAVLLPVAGRRLVGRAGQLAPAAAELREAVHAEPARDPAELRDGAGAPRAVVPARQLLERGAGHGLRSSNS